MQSGSRDVWGAAHPMDADGSTDIGLWRQYLTQAKFFGRPCLFLDRDGVIVEERHFLSRGVDVSLIQGISGAIALANRAGIPVAMVTNQSGIGRQLFDWADFVEVQQTILRNLEGRGARIDAVLACAYCDKGIGAYCVADHPWRKPRPGMLLDVASAFDIDLRSSFIVGDRISDLEAGRIAGLGAGALTLTGYGARDHARHSVLLDQWRSTGFDAQPTSDAAGAIRQWLMSAAAGGLTTC